MERDRQTKDYIKELSKLTKARELYKLRNDAQRYLRLGEQTLYERVAPLVQKPVTEKLDEVKQVLNVPQSQPAQALPQALPKQTKSYDEVFENIVKELSKLSSKQLPADSVRLVKTDEGYAIGIEPVTVIFHDQGRDIKLNDYQMPFSEDLENLLKMPKVIENGEELKQFKTQTLQDYVNLLSSSKSPNYKRSGNYKQAVRLLNDNPPSYRLKPGSGLEANRILTLLAAKAEGHNNVDEELAQLNGLKTVSKAS